VSPAAPVDEAWTFKIIYSSKAEEPAGPVAVGKRDASGSAPADPPVPVSKIFDLATKGLDAAIEENKDNVELSHRLALAHSAIEKAKTSESVGKREAYTVEQGANAKRDGADEAWTFKIIYTSSVDDLGKRDVSAPVDEAWTFRIIIRT
jgi:hypothetical protein